MSENKKADAYCPGCEAYIVNERVTFEECCDTCGAKIEWHGGFDRPTTTPTTPTPFINYLREVRDKTDIDSEQYDAINGAMHEIDDRVATETALRAEIDEAKKHTAIREIQAREAQRKLTLARAEVDRLKHYQYNCAEMERVNIRNDELKFQLGKKYREVDRLKVELAQKAREIFPCRKSLTNSPITSNNKQNHPVKAGTGDKVIKSEGEGDEEVHGLLKKQN